MEPTGFDARPAARDGRRQAAMEEAPDDSAFITSVLADIARARGIMQLANDTGI
jgi:DNA-binding phage protein